MANTGNAETKHKEGGRRIEGYGRERDGERKGLRGGGDLLIHFWTVLRTKHFEVNEQRYEIMELKEKAWLTSTRQFGGDTEGNLGSKPKDKGELETKGIF